jgi:hypothetical protein
MQDFYRVLEGYADRAAECAMFTCRNLVTDMIYESRISQNVAYKAKYGEKVKKKGRQKPAPHSRTIHGGKCRKLLLFILLRLDTPTFMFLYCIHLMTCRCLRGGSSRCLGLGVRLWTCGLRPIGRQNTSSVGRDV